MYNQKMFGQIVQPYKQAFNYYFFIHYLFYLKLKSKLYFPPKIIQP